MKPLLLILSLLITLNLSAQRHKLKNDYNPYQSNSKKTDWEATLLKAGSWVAILSSCYLIETGMLNKNKPKLFTGVGCFTFAIGYDFTIEWHLRKKKK